MRIAILSDTHNLLRPEVLQQLSDCDAVLHAGDVSRRDVLVEIGKAAPVYAVRGNNDKDWENPLPVCVSLTLGGLSVCIAHKRRDLPEDLSGYDLAVYGHTHRYAQTWLPAAGGGKQTLLLNPGSCGPGRFRLPVTMAMLRIGPDGWAAERVDIRRGDQEAAPAVGPDIRRLVETVMRETDKGRSPVEIAKRTGMDEALAEQIARLYVTHPGVSADGILTRMGL